jgi:ankyrin repeat protein
MEEGDCDGGDTPTDSSVRPSDEDLVDSIRISIAKNLADILRALLQDPRFRPDHCIQSDPLETPILHFSNQFGSFKSVKLLLEAGCHPNIVNNTDRSTSLHEYARWDTEDTAIAGRLLKLGVIDSIRDNLGRTCWHVAADNNNVPVLRVLINLCSNTQQSLATVSYKG